MMHKFAMEAARLTETAPFVVFNCADYANNPQLFGVKKGAYTGAVEQKGLIEKANGGILFLDEVHRLTPEGQEMLFTFIDGGMYRRLGESENANHRFSFWQLQRKIPFPLCSRHLNGECRWSSPSLRFGNAPLMNACY